MESPKVLNQPATPILIFFLTISLMFSVSGPEPYDYMQYVVQWQPAVCSNPDNHNRCTKEPEKSFTIHGLWPSNSNGGDVTCPGQEPAFDKNELRPILAELHKCWPNMLGRNCDFWGRQWRKHGRCSLNVFSNQLEYFNRAVTLCYRYNKRIKDILRGAKIYPPNAQTVKSSYIAREIEKKLRRRPALRCYFHKYVQRRRVLKQLQEVILCFDKRGEDLIDCPQRGTCPPDILFSL